MSKNRPKIVCPHCGERDNVPCNVKHKEFYFCQSCARVWVRVEEKR